jgi:hypothetical protein
MLHRTTYIAVAACLLLMFSLRALAADAPDPEKSLTIDQVIEAYKKALAVPDVISFSTTASYNSSETAAATTNPGNLYLPPPSTVFASVWRDHQRLKAELHTEWKFTGKETEVPADQSHEFLVSQVSVDHAPGEYFLDHTVQKNNGIDHRIDATTHTWAAWFRLPGLILDGRLRDIGDNDFADLLRESTSRKMTVEKDKEDGHAVYLVSASTPYGQCSVWIDPAKHFHPNRIEVHKTSKDWIAPNMPLTLQKKESVDFVAEDSRVEAVGEHWLMTHLRTTARIKYASGRVLQTNGVCERTHINLNPDFPKGTFSISAPNGTRVDITGKDGVKYEWIDGSILTVLTGHKPLINQLSH